MSSTSTESSIVALNNYLQKKGKQTSLVWHDMSAGERHAPAWTSECKVDYVVLGSGKGAKKTLSREAAAKKALVILISQDDEGEGISTDAATGSESAT
ncbi:hypothetical protein BC628DRAFT_1416289 [Trametes gibbosa]|nr:hypothetical protein BC628DRAFT_1416289 [Trametes gibbosa]